MDKIFSKSTQTTNFDIILGHSQGAILIAALLSLHEQLWNARSGPSGYILNGCAWPNPYRQSLMSISTRKEIGMIDMLPQIAFVIGKEDNINPVESAMKVRDAFVPVFDVSIVNHGGGHSVPMGDDEDSKQALQEIVDWIILIAKRIQLTKLL